MGQLLGSPQYTPYELPIAPLSIFLSNIPVNEGQLVFAVPAGLGDNLWIAGKLWSIVEKRNCKFLIPGQEQRRSADVYRMVGWQYEYVKDLSTEWIWNRPGSPPIPDTGAVLTIAPNRHLEHGFRIEKWYPELPFKNPVELFRDPIEPPILSPNQTPYVVVFMCKQGYMEDGGNLAPGQWGRILKIIERTYGPVKLIGAGEDVAFAQKVCQFYLPSLEPVYNAPANEIASIMMGAQLCIGTHAGPLILSSYLGKPTIHAYPRWLYRMAGTWEVPDDNTFWCYLDELELVVGGGLDLQKGERYIGTEKCLTTAIHQPSAPPADIPTPVMAGI